MTCPDLSLITLVLYAQPVMTQMLLTHVRS